MQAMIVRRLTEPPPSARAVRANLPESVDQAIRKALAPVAADRFGTMAQFGQALQADGDDVDVGGADRRHAADSCRPRPPTDRADRRHRGAARCRSRPPP